MREDLPELVQFAVDSGIRAVISTNGTLITREKAAIFAGIGLSYMGVSLDGTGEIHDKFRGVKGAFDAAVRGIRILSGRWNKGRCPFCDNRREQL